MAQSRVFVDERTGELDTDQIRAEAIPIAKLIALFVVIALVPFALGVFLAPMLGFPGMWLFVVVAQFVLAVGGAIVLLYTIVRAIKLAGTGPGGKERPVE